MRFRFDKSGAGYRVILGNQVGYLGRYQVNNLDSLTEILDLQAETARESERFDIMETIRSVFGNEVEVIEFEPYGEDK